ncbi:Hypothetical predicted protein, partial [Marmota monax]
MYRVTVREKDELERLKAILLGISSKIGVLQNLEEGFPSHEDQLRGLNRERFARTEDKLLRLSAKEPAETASWSLLLSEHTPSPERPNSGSRNYSGPGLKNLGKLLLGPGPAEYCG